MNGMEMNHSLAAFPGSMLEGAWTIDPSTSRISFRVRKVRVITVRGTFPVRAATLEIGPGPTLVRLEATIDAAGFSTGNSQRDADVTGPRFLGTERFGDITFRGSRLLTDEKGPRVEGVLTVRDKSRAQTLAIDSGASTIEDDGRLRVRATTTVDRIAYGIDAMRSIVAPTLAVTLDLVFLRFDKA
jgi:polyisoprenoid-binding protein YceI